MVRTLLIAVLLLTAGVARAQEVTMPLADWRALHERERVLRGQIEGDADGEVVVGETRYRGRIDAAGLHLTMVMRVELGGSERYKDVSVVGDRVIVVAAQAGGVPIALVDDGQYWTWVTRARGVAQLSIELVVPASGPRGSAEYLFDVVESPVTDLSCTFADRDLSPRVDGAVSNVVRQTVSGGELTAVIGPTRSIHLVGFRELAQTPTTTAKVYADTQSLMSLADESVELFTVVNLTILYAPQKRFRVALPSGYELVSADGEGAFQYTVETVDGVRVITGETSYGIRQGYEISLRLKRPLAAGESSVPLAVPRMLDVERDSGFVAIEVPGKLAITDVRPEGKGALVPIDVRELPPTLIDSSVTPIVRAFQYSDATSRAAIGIARYPTKPVEGDSIDALIVHTVATEDGERLTELSVRLRNAHRQYLSIGVATNVTVRSALVEGEPVKPSRDAQGKLLLPLVRSRQEGEGLRPIAVQLVYQEHGASFHPLGASRLELPAFELPIASLMWTLDVPERYLVSRLEGSVATQEYAGTAHWQSAPGEEEELEAYKGDEDYDERDQGLENAAMAHGRRLGGIGTRDDRGPVGMFGTRREAELVPQQAQASGGRGDGNNGGVAVRVLVPRAGHELSYRRYWIDAHEPVWVRMVYLRRAWLRGVEVAGLLVALAGVTFLVWRAEERRGRVLGWLRATAAGRTAWVRDGARATATAFANRFTNRKKTSPAWALIAAGGEIAFASAVAIALSLLGVALLVAVLRLAWLVRHPL